NGRGSAPFALGPARSSWTARAGRRQPARPPKRGLVVAVAASAVVVSLFRLGLHGASQPRPLPTLVPFPVITLAPYAPPQPGPSLPPGPVTVPASVNMGVITYHIASAELSEGQVPGDRGFSSEGAFVIVQGALRPYGVGFGIDRTIDNHAFNLIDAQGASHDVSPATGFWPTGLLLVEVRRDQSFTVVFELAPDLAPGSQLVITDPADPTSCIVFDLGL
ncbi:MAG: hypothetical protein LBH76_01305, partial [Propionibacteriaceae bacterium]|nr:hypothetical protein [Propionibacteriaceae bacterium]